MNKIVDEPQAGGFELSFAAFLEAAPDMTPSAKNYLAVGFKLDYVKADGDLSNYVDQKAFEQYTPRTMAAVAAMFTGYQP